MSGATTGGPPPRCTHPNLIPRRSTEGYDICALCGAAVYNTLGPQMLFTIRADPVPDAFCKKAMKPTWSTPPGAPKRRRPFDVR